MTRTAAALLLLLALVSVGSCAKYKAAKLDKKEWIVIPVWTDPVTRTCRVQEKTPSEIRTEFKSNVFWIIAGTCEGAHTIAIGRSFEQGNKTYDLFEDAGTHLEGNISSAESGPSLILKGKLKDRLQKGLYKYRILIDGKPAEFRSAADEGDFFLCPVWPCGNFND